MRGSVRALVFGVVVSASLVVPTQAMATDVDHPLGMAEVAPTEEPSASLADDEDACVLGGEHPVTWSESDGTGVPGTSEDGADEDAAPDLPHERFGDKDPDVSDEAESDDGQEDGGIVPDSSAKDGGEGASTSADADAAPGAKEVACNMYRLYNPNSGEHFYTASLDEARSVAGAGWRWEGVGWVAPTSGVPVYRLYNPYVGDHHYTASEVECDALVLEGWQFEGVGWHSEKASSGTVVMRQYNPNAVSGTHNFTANLYESDALLHAGWRWEGVAWYASREELRPIAGFWLVTSAWGSLERYWVDSNAGIARSRIIQASEGAGYDAYATPSGAVVRGVWDPGDAWAWLADNDGRLRTTSLSGEDWLVTGAFTGGALQRYRARPNDDYSHAVRVRVGLFWADGSQFWGIPNKGYVLRGTHIMLNGRYYLAESVVGTLSELTSGKYGWQNPAGYYQVSAYNVTLPAYSTGIFRYASPSVITPDATREQCVEAFVRRAEQYLGTPYVWDYACAPGVGVDCAGLVLQCLYAVGISPSKYTPHDHYYTPGNDHYAVDMLYDPMFKRVSFSSRKRGDLVFYSGHVAIYLGNNTIIHATPDRVRYDSVYRWTPLAVSRVFL